MFECREFLPSVRTSRRRPLSMLLAAVLSGAPASMAVAGGYVFDQVSTSGYGCNQPALACSPDGLTMIAWVEDGGPIPMDFVVTLVLSTEPQPGKAFRESVALGPGQRPALSWSREGFTVAYASDPSLVIQQSDLEGNWDPGDITIFTPHGSAFGFHTIDLWGNPGPGTGPHVYLAAGGIQYQPDLLLQVYYTGRTDFGWSDLEIVAEAQDVELIPQITYATGPYGPLPEIYYTGMQDGEFQLLSITNTLESGWTEPMTVPGEGGGPCPVAGEFDAAAWDYDGRAILGVGLQPTCPCNRIYDVQREPFGDWLVPVDLTVAYAEYDWPQSPRVATDADGRIHAFWYQEASNMLMQPVRRTLEYWIKEDGSWSEAGAFFADQEGGPLGSHVAMAMTPEGRPVFAFTRQDTIDGQPQPRQIWIARYSDVTAVAGNEAPHPAMALTAWPNPCNPTTTITWGDAPSGQLRIRVYDLRGQLIRTLLDDRDAASAGTISWNGKDQDGKEVPSGVYLVRLQVPGGETACQRVSLLR